LDKYEALPLMRGKKPKFFYGYIIVLAGFFITMVAFGTLFSFGIFFKPLSTELGLTRAVTSGAYSLSMLSLGLTSIVIGRLSDKFGPRLVVTVCGSFLGLGYLLMSQLNAIWQLYLFYGVIVGIGMSASFVPLMSTVARWFVKRRGLMTGLVVSGIGIGGIIMPPIVTQLISSYGWRISYLILGIIILVVIIMAAQFLRRDPGQVAQFPDGQSVVKRGSILSEVKGFSRQEAIHTRQFWMLCAIFLSCFVSIDIILVHIVPHATDLGISPPIASSILSIIGALSIVGRIGMGSAGDRIGNKLALIISFILLAVALFWLLGAKELWMLYLFAAIFGFSYGSTSVLMSPTVADLFGLRSHGEILGMVLFGTTIGSAIGPVVVGHIFDITGSYQLGFLVIAILSFIGLILVSILRPTSGQGERSAPERSTGLY